MKIHNSSQELKAFDKISNQSGATDFIDTLLVKSTYSENFKYKSFCSVKNQIDDDFECDPRLKKIFCFTEDNQIENTDRLDEKGGLNKRQQKLEMKAMAASKLHSDERKPSSGMTNMICTDNIQKTQIEECKTEQKSGSTEPSSPLEKSVLNDEKQSILFKTTKVERATTNSSLLIQHPFSYVLQKAFKDHDLKTKPNTSENQLYKIKELYDKLSSDTLTTDFDYLSLNLTQNQAVQNMKNYGDRDIVLKGKYISNSTT